MAVLNNSNAISPSGYDVNNSLRFRSSASATLTRTTSAGSSTTATWSFWMKRGSLAGRQVITGWSNASNTAVSIEIDANNNFKFNQFASVDVIAKVTSQVFRDPSAWYHIVVTLDTTNATAEDRARIYVNGSRVTNWTTNTNPSLNYATSWGSSLPLTIGNQTNGVTYFDGYLAEWNFIDGQALTPSSFGATDATTGVWKPKAYTGTYGTNGFYLKFSDIATTSGSNAGLGKDFSGNANYWTTNNISVTAGSTYDAMKDSPTNTSATVANYAVMNPLSKGTSQTALTEGNLYAIPTSGASNWGTVFSTIAIPTSGKYYIEATAVVYAGSGNNSSLGVVDSAIYIPTNATITANTAILYQYTTGEGFDGILCHLFSDYVAPIDDGVQGTNVTGITGTSVNLMLALDVDNGKVYAGYNGTWLNSGNPAGGTGQVATRTFSSTDVVAGNTSYNGTNDQAQYFNFGQRPFTYTPPTGFVALNTYNLSTPTILQGNKYMDATTYSGNSSSQSIVNAGAFKPDMIWFKNRNSTENHAVFDTLRPLTTALRPNSTIAEYTNTDTDDFVSYNSNGFSLNGNGDTLNFSSKTYVAWQWQAGQGSTSSNTSGTITSTVSVNTTAGFSIVTFTGNATAGSTVGHGLGVAPKFVIYKARNNGNDWWSYHVGLTSAAYAIQLNTTNAQNNTVNFFNSTAPSATVLTLGYWNNVTGFNLSTQNYVAYCWAEIAGFSKFGSYTGNGSADGPFVFTNLKPRFIMIKRTDSTSNWTILDTAREGYNVDNDPLYPNLSDAEGTTDLADILSNGFKLRSTDASVNANAGTYIYACFSSNPFKNSTAV